jgi:hypothetical protein
MQTFSLKLSSSYIARYPKDSHTTQTFTQTLLHKIPTSTMASSNPSNFANLPKDELKEIAAKGGHASHGSGSNQVSHRHLSKSFKISI